MLGFALAAMLSGAAVPPRYLGETFDCHFPKTGHVVIDTREPGGSITVNGRRYAGFMGSDHFGSDEVMFLFKPDMNRWANRDTTEPFVRCGRHRNLI